MVTVSGRKLHSGAKGNTFVPEKGIFPGETTAGGELCPQMWQVSGRKLHSSSKGNTFVPEKGIFPGETIAGGSIYPQNTLPAWMKAASGLCASTKYPPSVDKCRSPAVRIHKTPSQRGQMPPPGSAHPQNTIVLWMQGIILGGSGWQLKN